MAKFVSTSRELIATSTLMIAVVKAIPIANKSKDAEKFIEKLNELSSDMENIETYTVEEFNNKYMLKDGPMTVMMDGHRQIVMEINEDFVVESTEAIIDEVPTLVGIGVTIAGAMMMLKSRMTTLSNRLNRIADKFKN